MDDRAEQMAAMYRSGLTLQEVGDRYGISRERIRQLISRFGICSKDGGRAKQAKDALERQRQARDRRCQAKWGCSFDQYRILQRVGRNSSSWNTTIFGAFRIQKRNAMRRGISWELTIWQWWEIWRDSGKWDERGRAAFSYVMARRCDVGPYAKGNVYICTKSQNSRDYYTGKYLLKKAAKQQACAA